jgi:chorismate mutase/prephenate dehydratase
VIAGHDAGPSGADRSSLVCSAQNRPGGLYQLLAPFADNGVSMSRLESRPARGFGGSRWEYVFYIDIEGPSQRGGSGAGAGATARPRRLRQDSRFLSESRL